MNSQRIWAPWGHDSLTAVNPCRFRLPLGSEMMGKKKAVGFDLVSKDEDMSPVHFYTGRGG